MEKLNDFAYILLLFSVVLCAFWDFKIFGDVFRFSFILFFIPLLYQKDFKKILILIIAFCCACAVTYGLKFIIEYAANAGFSNWLEFAKRPINARYNGFPSGHATTAFVGFGFAYYFCSLRFKIAFFIIAIFVASSRLTSHYHTLLQVICGAFVGFLVSSLVFYLAKKYALKDSAH